MTESLINEAPTEQVDTAAPAVESEALAQQEASRPEWLPEKYKTPEDLAKAYKELESKIGTKEETLREQLLKEIEDKAYEGRPATKGEYQLPESIDDTDVADSELLGWWAEHAFENGYSQEEFQKGVEMYATSMGANAPDLDKEAKRLGENSSTRIESASLFAGKFFPKDVMPAIERMCETADGILALEHIMEQMKTPSMNASSDSPSQVSEDSLRAMMQDERYHNPVRRDAAFVKQVENGFKQLYRA
jgi:hypothetical protein